VLIDFTLEVLPSVKKGGAPGGGSDTKPSGSSGSGKGGSKPTASVTSKPHGSGSHGDNDVTTTVTSYFTKNGKYSSTSRTYLNQY
jgi:hypothetical protein